MVLGRIPTEHPRYRPTAGGVAAMRDDQENIVHAIESLTVSMDNQPEPRPLRASPIVDEWRFHLSPDGAVYVSGVVSNHERARDGGVFDSGAVMAVDPVRRWFRTSNGMVYRLG